jgi:hypothetical protein
LLFPSEVYKEALFVDGRDFGWFQLKIGAFLEQPKGMVFENCNATVCHISDKGALNVWISN